MRMLYGFASPTGYEGEVVIPEGSSLADTVEQIMRVSGM